MHIGIAGIGKMGAAIAHRLIEVGHAVTVWNRTADKLAARRCRRSRCSDALPSSRAKAKSSSPSSPMRPLSTQVYGGARACSPATCVASCSSR